MVGQKYNKEIIEKWVSTKTVPQFIIIIGARGSGKKTLAHTLVDKMKKFYVPIGIKVENIREMIELAHKVPSVYVIEDADTMSTQAKNSMLKIVEEPPIDTYFIMTVSDESTLLDTIKSRARIMYMDIYSTVDLNQYKSGLSLRYYNIAKTPYQLDKLEDYGKDFIDFVQLFIDNICKVESANAFKVGTKLALKTDSGYDVELFMQTVIYTALSMELESEDKRKYLSYLVLYTCAAAQEICKVGANKQQIFDMWIMNVRSIQ